LPHPPQLFGSVRVSCNGRQTTQCFKITVLLCWHVAGRHSYYTSCKGGVIRSSLRGRADPRRHLAHRIMLAHHDCSFKLAGQASTPCAGSSTHHACWWFTAQFLRRPRARAAAHDADLSDCTCYTRQAITNCATAALRAAHWVLHQGHSRTKSLVIASITGLLTNHYH
jgi:hypothetical protein